MTCEVYENLLSGICVDCGKRYEIGHVIGILIRCPSCCPVHNPSVREPSFDAYMPTTEGELFHE